MNFKVRLAKILMKLFPSTPQYTVRSLWSEAINHRNFLDADEAKRNKILFEMARAHYWSDQRKPFDLFYPDTSLKKVLQGRTVLDLGCGCGGASVSFAERWNVQAMHGIDMNSHLIRGAKLFSASRKIQNVEYQFTLGVGEALPYENRMFDAIIARDVLEHVASLSKTLHECKRTLKPKGKLFAVFPSYYFPLGGAHLDLVSKTPCIQWFFDAETLNRAYNQILDSRGPEAYWYKTPRFPWQKLSGGIGVNGTTFHEFGTVAKQAGFARVTVFPTPLLSVSDISVSHPRIKIACQSLKPLLKYELLQEYLSHRIVALLIA
jgi:2-polyprenyl-3-methyl-5-hydroxy-6-metoxy-1,4-benzoquinol methylase